MTTPSQFDPLADAPRSLRARLARKFGRTIEPMAVNLLSWCRSLDHRVESIEGRLEADEARLRAVSQAIRGIEDSGARLEALEALAPKVTAIVPKLASMTPRRVTAVESLQDKVRALEARSDQAFWGREALVERMNQDDAREAAVVGRVSALEVRADQLYWGREALVERMNRDDAVVEVIDRRITALQEKVDEQAPLPLSFGLDYLAMGRRLAALEDQVELLLGQLSKEQEGRATTLVAFPEAPEKAVG